MRYLIIFSFLLSIQISLFSNEGIEYFENKVRPIFSEYCVECHGPKKQKSGLRLDSVEHILAGGETDKLYVPGQPDTSYIVEAIKRIDEDFEMPPKKPLPTNHIQTIETWIKMGAPMPKTNKKIIPKTSYDWENMLKFWSFVKPQKITLDHPETHPIDQIVKKDLLQLKLDPNEKASKKNLIRRVSYDLTGLAPTPEEIKSYLNDHSSNSYETMLNTYLDSPHFGERWARHWLDVTRYGDDQPYAFAQKPLTQAWKYRDWVVDAFNTNLPYTDFIKRQLAADLLPNLAPQEIAATGMIATGPMYFKRTQVQKALADELDDRIDVVSKGFLGLTVSCARCHNHKYDPIPTADYYALAGVFKSTRIYDRFNASEEDIAKYQHEQFEVDKINTELYETHISNLNKAKQQLKDIIFNVAKTVKNNQPFTSLMKESDPHYNMSKKWHALFTQSNYPATGSLKMLLNFINNHEASKSNLIELDDTEAIKVGHWVESTHYKGYTGKHYLHDGAKQKGSSKLTFKLPITQTSKFELFLAYNSNNGRSNKVPIQVQHSKGMNQVYINQKNKPNYKDKYTSLGVYEFNPSTSSEVIISNQDTQGYVIVDSLLLVPHGMKTNTDTIKLHEWVTNYVDEIYSLINNITQHEVNKPFYSTKTVSQSSHDHRETIHLDVSHLNELYLVTESKTKNNFKFHYNAWLNPTLQTPQQLYSITDLEPTDQYTEGTLFGAKYDTQEDAIICNGEVVRHGIQNIGTNYLKYDLTNMKGKKLLNTEVGIYNKAGNEINNNLATFHIFSQNPSPWLKRQKQIEELNQLTNSILSPSSNLKKSNIKRPPVMHALWESQARNSHINVRGNPLKLGEEVPRGYLSILNKGKRVEFKKGSGRLELANLIANKENPLTARVFVNRIWHHLFGKGLVTSPSNFGLLGDKPSHPSLLDWLAVEFMDNGWDIKHMIKYEHPNPKFVIHVNSSNSHMSFVRIDISK